MDIDLLACTPDMLKVIWTAARTCKTPYTPIELWDTNTTDDVSRNKMLAVVNHVIRSGHLSVAEHCTMTFAVSGVSRTLLAQYSRHRIGVSLSVQSQRHVEPASWNGEYPPSVAGDKVKMEKFREAIRDAQISYQQLLAVGVKKEDARFVLPEGSATNFITTLNLRSLMDVYQKRVVTPGAQREIKAMVKRFAELVCERESWLRKHFPGLEAEV